VTTSAATSTPTPAAPLAAGLGALDDGADRRAIAEDLDATMFVEAGAGTGKTSALVGRVVALATAPPPTGVRLREVAAITFTEKAAAELRDRIRVALEETARTDDDRERRERARQALDDLDGAAIGTLHAFAQRILTEHPFEAGLPPDVAVLDEIASAVEFDHRFAEFQDRLLSDPVIERSLLLALAGGIRVSDLRDLAVAFGANWDLVADHVATSAPEPPALDPAALAARVREAEQPLSECSRPDDDLLARHVRDLVEWAEGVLAAAADEAEVIRLVGERPTKGATNGQKGNWRDVGAAREAVAAVHASLTTAVNAAVEAATRRLAADIAAFTIEAANERRADGRLEFHDLLVMARSLLRDPRRGAAVRRALHRRYQRVLLDEFQDTDPIQIDLAVLITTSDPAAGGADWRAAAVDPGRLFVVGDPKQSIYRFRRADIATYLDARTSIDADRRSLVRSFRSAPRVVEFVNAVFDDLIVATPQSQPEYAPLVANRTDEPTGPGVMLVGREHDTGTKAGPLREAEADDVADAALAALGWKVADRPAGADHATAAHRPARLGDIAILLPARTSLPQLEQALDRRGIPYRAETSSLVYGTREIRDLMAALRAVADPTDELSLVAALRSPLYGCGDDDLYTFHEEHGGRWNHRAPLPEELPADHPVAAAMTHLADLHADRLWLTPSAILDRIVRERRVLEVAFARGRPRDLWRRVRFVVDQARAFTESAGGSLAEYLEWVALQSSEGARVVESILPETDDDAVRILTVHGAKGLEFPIVILSGMTTRPAGRRSRVEVRFPPTGGWALKVGQDFVSEEFERFKPIDEQMDFDERVRLLYVAATRARDHLVVSVHRVASPVAEPAKRTNAELVWGSASARPDLWSEPDAGERAATSAPRAAVDPPGDRAAWQAERAAALARAGRRRVVSATGVAAGATEHEDASLPAVLDPGLAKEPVDLELPPWQRGRYGTAIGRAVHAVLQTVDLQSGAGIDDAARAQAAAEGVTGHEARIAALARAAIASPVVQEAVAGAYWRETYVGSVVGGGDGSVLVEGYVDLVYRSAAGLVVVDYKTDAWGTDADLDAKLARYRLQGATYALAVQQATGEPVVRCVFLFLREDSAVAREVTDLAGAIDDVRAAVSSA
jgi:ATP-dependent helicase/nuclease subunit A